MYTRCLFRHICIHVYTYTHTQTQTRMHVFLCTHSVSVYTHGVCRVYIYICIYLHTHIRKKTCKQDTNTDMYGCIGMHALYIHTRCLFIHICIDVHTYTNTCKLSLTTCKHIYHLQTRCTYM